MKLPRDVSGPDLVKALRHFGYEVTRQRGSHIRLTTQQNGEHHVTIPHHSQIRVGTLSDILTAVGEHFDMTKDEVASAVFST
jgi:predicted RNA binding protein YcfA (HicA-like mRNA interferase family)